MGLNKIFFYIFAVIILSGCAQSTAMLGPALTLASTGNASQAGLTFITNKVVKKETGMDTLSLVSNKIEQNSFKNRKFKKCPPFAHYKEDPNSCYYTLNL